MNLTVASSPHIRGDFRSSRLMLDVCIALLPALAMGTWVLGVRSLLVVAVSILSAMGAEWLYALLTKKRNTLPDCSAMVTGLLLAMTLPASIPLYQAALGSAFAIVVVKLMAGGLGQNVFNPALTARALMMVIWPVSMVRFNALGVDGATAATPLHHMVMPALPEESLMDMFLGNIPGCIGEVSAAALILGCLLYTSPSPRDGLLSRMPSSA